MNVRSSSTCVESRLLDGVQVDFHTVADRERQALPPRHGWRLAARRLHILEVAPAFLRGGAYRFASAAHLFVAAPLSWLWVVRLAEHCTPDTDRLQAVCL